MSNKVMQCAYCGKTRKYPQEFPAPHYSKCTYCYKKENKFLNILGKLAGITLIVASLSVLYYGFKSLWNQ